MTYIYQRMTAHDALEACRTAGRLLTDTNPGNFSYDGIRALFEYLEDLSEGMGEPIELDIIALCCDYAEYGTARDAIGEYDNDEEVASLVRQYDEANRGQDFAKAAMIQNDMLDWLRDRTTVIQFDTGVILQSF